MPPTRCFVVWKKLTISDDFSMAMAEYAWTSFNSNAKVFECAPQGKKNDPRFHPCLPKGELVFFNGKWKKIEEVKVGDRNQFGKVSMITEHIATKIVEISTEEGNVTNATYNHPFLILRNDEIAWVEAEQIKKGDKIVCIKSTNKQKKDICDIEQMENDCEWNIASYGKNTMGKSQKGCRYITLTGIRQITTFPICNLSLPLNTDGFTRVATLKKGFGISLVSVVGNIKRLMKKIGITTKKQGTSIQRIVDRAMSKRLSQIVECELQTVGNVRIIQRKTSVLNLVIDGIPAFETKIGISHNTQKPVALYKWLINKFAKEGDTILDTHVGSASSLIACHETGHKYVGFEIDEEYYRLAKERLERETAQMNFFNMGYELC